MSTASKPGFLDLCQFGDHVADAARLVKGFVEAVDFQALCGEGVPQNHCIRAQLARVLQSLGRSQAGHHCMLDMPCSATQTVLCRRSSPDSI